ncbi:hypothetical protein QJS10_CPB18g00126 [Acorus calamus]|uniref:Uncharacterized protein n=1 Tax=Acorus calamus TaxID=4465 RepID=A0AAV9CKC1_ACOCL|nr:hypothetical protein QJS10_CPB18g00126 [Acorus calamus]
MVFDSAVDVVVLGPTLGLNPPREAALPPLPAHPAVATAFLNEGKRKEREEGRDRNGFCLGTNFSIDDCSDSSSSIGDGSLSAAEDGDGDGDADGEGEVQSRLKEGPLGCLDSLEDSLPIKKGLSNCFSGKSKSFASLSDAATAKDLVKPENPFNKRRRILMACKVSLSRRTTSYCSLNMSTLEGLIFHWWRKMRKRGETTHLHCLLYINIDSNSRLWIQCEVFLSV